VVERFEDLNANLEQQCLRRFETRVRGHSETIGERLERDVGFLRGGVLRMCPRHHEALYAVRIVFDD
jgi:hypothetical protein